MPTPHEMPPQDDDIRQALAASCPPESNPTGEMPEAAEGHSATLVRPGSGMAVARLRYAMTKCGLMAERYPWQTTGALLLTIGCGWLCGYFGWTVLAALILFAVYSED